MTVYFFRDLSPDRKKLCMESISERTLRYFPMFLMSGASGGRQIASTPTEPSTVDHTAGGVPAPIGWISKPGSVRLELC